MDDDFIAVLIESKAKDAQAKIAEYLARSKLSSMCYAYRHRYKPHEKLIEKKKRKLLDKPDYSIEKITDVVGLRLVTLFRNDMPSLVEGVIESIDNLDGTADSPFLNKSIEEIIIYCVNPKYDSILPDLRERVKDLGYGVLTEVKHSGEGYSSIHIVARVDVCVEQLCKGKYHIPIEIQIRTVYEDAWGEIDHKYGYVVREGKDEGAPICNPEFVLEHLKILKKFSDACSEYADMIRYEASVTPTQGTAKGKVISVDPDDSILERFRELGLDHSLITGYIEARAIKEEANTLQSDGKENCLSIYSRAADGFRELVDNLGDGPFVKSDLARYLFYYYARMNEAICMMSTRVSDNIQVACNIYSLLEDTYGDFPLLKMRYAQALARLGHGDRAIAKYYKARESLGTFYENGKYVTRDELQKSDLEHLCRVLSKLLGYELWKKTLDISDASEKCNVLREAYEITYEGLRQKCLSDAGIKEYKNNLLYYAVEYLQVPCLEGSDKFVKSLHENISAFTESLGKSLDLEEGAEQKNLDLELLDTLMKAYSFTGDQEKAKKLAKIITDLALDSSNLSYNKDIKLLLAENANEVMKSFDS